MEELRRIREARGLSKTALAKKAGVGRVTIVHTESGKSSPNVEILRKLAAALDCEVADFFPKAQSPLFEPQVVEISAAGGAAGGATADVRTGVVADLDRMVGALRGAGHEGDAAIIEDARRRLLGVSRQR